MSGSTLKRWQDCAARCGMPLPSDFATQSLASASSTFVKAWRAQSSMQIIEYSAAPAPTAALIFCHGLGDTGMGWASSFQDLSYRFPHVLFVFPTARSIPVTLNMDMKMPAWYDIKSLGGNRLLDEAEGLEDSVCFMDALATEVATKIAPSTTKGLSGDEEFNSIDAVKARIAVGGFSQGAALSLFVGHTTPEGSQSKTGFAGVAAVSGYLTARTAFLATKRDFTKNTPLFVGHGDSDDVVPITLSKESFEFLHEKHRGENSGSSYKVYPGMPHSSCEEEMDDIAAFLKKILPEQK